MEYVYPQTSVKNAEIAKVSKTQQMDVPLKKMGKDVPRERSAVQKVSTVAWIWMAGIAMMSMYLGMQWYQMYKKKRL